jgi:hypothetical protein
MNADCFGLVQPLKKIHHRRLFWLGTTTHTNTRSLTVLAWHNHLNKKWWDKAKYMDPPLPLKSKKHVFHNTSVNL